MTALEKQELEKLRQEKEKRRKQAKQWNENAKKKWETVSCRLPAGTKARIESTGESINGMINRLILAELDAIESGAEPETVQGEEKNISWPDLQEMQKKQAEQEHAELVNAKQIAPAEHGEITKALFYHGEITQETDTSSATPEALALQAELERKREQYQQEKQKSLFEQFR